MPPLRDETPAGQDDVRCLSSKDVLNVNAGSLYPALYRLEERGLIRAEWAATEKGRKAKVYSLTAVGRKQLADERATWQRFSGALAAILGTR